MAYGLLPVFLMGACFLADTVKLNKRVISTIETTGKVLGKYSYSIYVVHYPILFLFAAFFHNAALCLLLSLVCITAWAIVLENYLQPAVVNYYRKLRNRQLQPAAFDLKNRPEFTLNPVHVKKIILPIVAAVSWMLFNR
jgi:peptidoglycan/LPS O-acetylase OafA/YrhL